MTSVNEFCNGLQLGRSCIRHDNEISAEKIFVNFNMNQYNVLKDFDYFVKTFNILKFYQKIPEINDNDFLIKLKDFIN